MSTTTILPQSSPIVSSLFCCRHCRSDVALELQGGGLYYACQNQACQWACEVDCVEALGIKDEPTPPATPAARKAAYHLAGGLDIRPMGTGYLVPSGTRAGVIHRVEGNTCSCEAGQSGKLCWHREAVRQAMTRRAA
jgi:hypothetical protein